MISWGSVRTTKYTSPGSATMRILDSIRPILLTWIPPLRFSSNFSITHTLYAVFVFVKQFSTCSSTVYIIIFTFLQCAARWSLTFTEKAEKLSIQTKISHVTYFLVAEALHFVTWTKLSCLLYENATSGVSSDPISNSFRKNRIEISRSRTSCGAIDIWTFLLNRKTYFYDISVY